MIKIILYSYLITLTIFSLPLESYATSGACSSHQGVNCSYGATAEGKVMCNDGWVNSSVYFSDVQECKVECTYPSEPYCDLDQIEDDRDSALGSYRSQASRGGLLGSEMYSNQVEVINQQYDSELATCEAQWESYEDSIDNYNICVNSSTRVSGQESDAFDTEILSRIDQYCKDANGPLSKGVAEKIEARDENPCSPTIDELHQMCEENLGRAYYDKYENTCRCSTSGHVVSGENGQCVSRNDEEKRVLGEIFDSTIVTMPQYQNIADRDIIVAIAMGSMSKDKTMGQIITETYPDIDSQHDPIPQEEQVTRPAITPTTPPEQVLSDKAVKEDSVQPPINQFTEFDNTENSVTATTSDSDLNTSIDEPEKNSYQNIEEVAEEEPGFIVRIWNKILSWF